MQDPILSMRISRRAAISAVRILLGHTEELLQALENWDVTSPKWPGINTTGSFQSVTKTEAAIANLNGQWAMYHALQDEKVTHESV